MIFDAHAPLNELLSVSMSKSWTPLAALCQSSTENNDIYLLMFLFSTMAYGCGYKFLTTLRTLLAFAFVDDLQEVPLPSNSACFEARKGMKFNDAHSKKF